MRNHVESNCIIHIRMNMYIHTVFVDSYKITKAGNGTAVVLVTVYTVSIKKPGLTGLHD